MFRSSKLAVMGGAICVALLMICPLTAQEGVSLAINEIVASNRAVGGDPQGRYDDWIAIYNYGDAPVDLAGMYLTDNPDEPKMWQVPAGVPALTTVAPQGYVVIWADAGDNDLLHAGRRESGSARRTRPLGSDLPGADRDSPDHLSAGCRQEGWMEAFARSVIRRRLVSGHGRRTGHRLRHGPRGGQRPQVQGPCG